MSLFNYYLDDLIFLVELYPRDFNLNFSSLIVISSVNIFTNSIILDL